MSRYDGLDKADLTNLQLIDTYRRVKIYRDLTDETYSVVSRGYLVDEQLNLFRYAKQVVDHFKSD